jgi:hypothetical protein
VVRTAGPEEDAMKKKSPKQLKLSKETVRDLEEAERGDLRLREVAGGWSYTCVRISACHC